jgi:hypothetical protein
MELYGPYNKVVMTFKSTYGMSGSLMELYGLDSRGSLLPRTHIGCLMELYGLDNMVH